MELFSGFKVGELFKQGIYEIEKGKATDFINQICCVSNNCKILMLIHFSCACMCNTETQMNLEK